MDTHFYPLLELARSLHINLHLLKKKKKQNDKTVTKATTDNRLQKKPCLFFPHYHRDSHTLEVIISASSKQSGNKKSYQ